MEREYKFELKDPEVINEILSDKVILSYAVGEVRDRLHRAVYFDTDDDFLSHNGIMLRLRREEHDEIAVSVLCMKIEGKINPDSLKERHEHEAILPEATEELPGSYPELLRSVGAPEAALSLLKGLTIKLRGFVRYSRKLLTLDIESSRCELSLDSGVFPAGKEFYELEIEYVSGDIEKMKSLAEYCRGKFGLHIQPMSKRARSRI